MSEPDLSVLSDDFLLAAYDRLADVEARLGRVEGQRVRSEDRRRLCDELLRRLAVQADVASAVAAERQRCVALVRRLLYNDQRVCSWHECADVLKAIHRGDLP